MAVKTPDKVNHPSIEVKLPQGRGFQLIHRVKRLTADEVTAEYDYTGNEVLLTADHFPGCPIFPGVLSLEGMNQTAIQLAQSIPGLKDCNFFLTGCNAKFRRAVKPPATIKFTGHLIHISPNRSGSIGVSAHVGGHLAAEAVITFIVMK